MSDQRLHVLIVEDDSSSAGRIRQTLVARGHHVTIADGPGAALSGCLPDVLITDVRVGGADGLLLLEELRYAGAACRTIVTTGNAGMDTCRRAFRAGADEVLVKPVDVERLAEIVEDTPDQSATTGRLRRAFPADDLAARRAGRAVNAWMTGLGALPSTRCRVASATAEAVDNAARHSGAERVEVRAESGPHTLVIEVRDHGAGFDPVAAGLDTMQSCLDGGLARMSSLAEDVQIDSAAGAGTRITLRFSIQSSRFEEEAELDLSENDFFTPADATRALTTLGEDGGSQAWHISPAMAVSIGRLLVGPDPRRVLRTALWS